MSTKTKDPKNQRKNERKESKIPLKLDPVHIFTEHQIVNISKGGIFISTPRPLPTDTDIEIEFFLPKAPSKIRAKGKVKWAMENVQRSNGKPGIVPGMGIKFIQISKESLKEIQSYLKKKPS